MDVRMLCCAQVFSAVYSSSIVCAPIISHLPQLCLTAEPLLTTAVLKIWNIHHLYFSELQLITWRSDTKRNLKNVRTGLIRKHKDIDLIDSPQCCSGSGLQDVINRARKHQLSPLPLECGHTMKHIVPLQYRIQRGVATAVSGIKVGYKSKRYALQLYVKLV